MKKVLITPRSFGKTSDKPFALLRAQGYELIVNDTGKPYAEKELIELVDDIDGLIVGTDTVSRKVLQQAKKLKVIAKYGVGLDNIDVEEARRLGIQVTFTPGANKESVADLAFCFILALSRNLLTLDKTVRTLHWDKSIGMEAFGKTLGLFGTGNIGKNVIRRARGFNMAVLAYDVYPDHAFAKEWGVQYVDKDTLLKQADFVSIHLPYSQDMYHFIGEKELGLMKPSSYLVNTARGGMIDEAALHHALINKKIAGAALDVFETEPPGENKLLQLDNVILSPHCGAATLDATENMGVMAAEGLISILENDEPKYLYA